MAFLYGPNIAPLESASVPGNTTIEQVDQAGSGSVLLLGNYRPTLTVARMLAREGHRIIIGTGGGEGYTEYSNMVAEKWDHPSLDTPRNEFMSALNQFLAERPDIRYIYPVAEEFVTYLAKRETELPHRVVLASPSSKVVAACTDKLSMLTLAAECGIDGPPFCAVDGLKDLNAAAYNIGYPLVIRPLKANNRIGHKKAVIATGPDDLEKLRAVVGDGNQSFLLQSYFAGERQDVFFAARNGKILRSMQVKYLRTDHSDGTGLCVLGEVIERTDELCSATTRLVSALNYNGIGCAQFVIDPETRKFCFLEINPRTSAIHQAAEATGMDLSRFALTLADESRNNVLGINDNYQTGLRFVWSYGELRAIKSAIKNREIGPVRALGWFLQMLYSAIRADVHLTWSWRDPLPTIMLFLAQLRRKNQKYLAVSGEHLLQVSSNVITIPYTDQAVARHYSSTRGINAPERCAPLRIEQVDFEQWDQLSASFLDTSPDQAAAFVQNRWGKHRTECITITSGNTLIGGACVVTFRLPIFGGGIAWVKHGPVWRRSGMLSNNNYLTVVNAMRTRYGQQGYAVLVVPRPHPDTQKIEVDTLCDLGFTNGRETVDPNRYLVNASLDEHEQMASLAQKWRYNLRKSRVNGLAISRGDDAGDIAAFSLLYSAMVSRKGFASTDPIEAIPDMLAKLPKRQKPIIFLVRHNDRPIAGAVVTICGDTAYYLFGASNHRALPLKAGYALQWSVLEHLRSHDVDWYDLGGEAGMQGLAQFKKGLVGKRGVILQLPGEMQYCHNFISRFARETIFGANKVLQGLRRLNIGARIKSR